MNSDQIEELRITVGELAHDVRSPLTSIGGFARLLLEDESITGENREFASLIVADVEQLTQKLITGFAEIERQLA